MTELKQWLSDDELNNFKLLLSFGYRGTAENIVVNRVKEDIEMSYEGDMTLWLNRNFQIASSVNYLNALLSFYDAPSIERKLLYPKGTPKSEINVLKELDDDEIKPQPVKVLSKVDIIIDNIHRGDYKYLKKDIEHTLRDAGEIYVNPDIYSDLIKEVETSGSDEVEFVVKYVLGYINEAKLIFDKILMDESMSLEQILAIIEAVEPELKERLEAV